MDDKKKKKEFISPEAEVINFDNNDIITLSGYEEMDWNDGGTREGW